MRAAGILARLATEGAIARPMEDEGFVDDEFIEETARAFVARDGFEALAVLRERARLAEATGDYVLAETWRQIVDRAERMINLEL